MGNRAVIVFGSNLHCPAIYVHWNGGRDTIEPALNLAKEFGIADPDENPQAAAEGVARMFTLFFEGKSKVDVDKAIKLDCENGDNGAYFVGKGFVIVNRRYFNGREQRHYDPAEVREAFIKACAGEFQVQAPDRLECLLNAIGDPDNID